ncbi:MAG: hypothetical protein K2N51_20795 [Lachnospiraceae bacterium]|nr:hypothetical protein [Lachnospiraceae bacterium]
MNYYFLLEDEKSFIKVLPKWLEYMGFHCMRVADITDVTDNSYVMQSGQGVTQLITKVLYQTIDTILNSSNRIDSLVVIVDAEEEEVETRKHEIYTKISDYESEKEVEFDFDVKVIVCNHCFESWLLGNEDIYPIEEPDKSSFFYPYYVHYNVKTNDPEYMQVPEEINEPTARYHFHYLHDAFLYKKIRYNKKKPDYVATKSYFSKLVSRMDHTVHIRSFKELYDYIHEQNIK